MAKMIWVEVCLVSARGLRRSSSLWKLQWFAVGWIDSANKYCTKIDASGNANPVWKTKFSSLLELDDSTLQDMALQVEIYSRDPIFLRERLEGTATVALVEFLSNYNSSSKNQSSGTAQVGSYQLRKRNSNKPQGFVDISIRISEEREEHSTSYLGNEEGHGLSEHRIDDGGGGSVQGPGAASFQHPVNQSQINSPHPMPNYSNTPTFYQPDVGPSSSYQPPLRQPSSNMSLGGPNHVPVARPGYQPPRTSTPPPPPPPSNVGYIPTLLPRTEHGTATCMNMPTSSSAGAGAAAEHGPRPPGFAMGVGTGALAAGALIFGDDFMSGFDLPRGLPDPTLSIYTGSLF